jgi:hypothetical protein
MNELVLSEIIVMFFKKESVFLDKTQKSTTDLISENLIKPINLPYLQ